ncbi:hypothetical protein ACS0TY_030500 [Phlomoides rotata]
MWMMGYNVDGGDFGTIQDPFTGRKLRPLMPRPATAAASNHPCLTRLHGADLLTLNHHLVRMGEENKRDIGTQQVVVSSRWNPTPEQLQSLEELYRRGTRTPSAEQIQHITAELRRYGKIEGKNVFYWFQNHKARERQKRRRQQSLSDEKREAAGTNKTVYEVEQTKNWASPTNSSTLAEKSGEAEAECKAGEGWVQFEDDAEQQRRRNATWRMMNLSSPITTTSSSSSSAPTVTSAAAIPSTVQFKPQDLFNIFLEPYDPGADAGVQTLQLFPLRRGGVEEESTNTTSHVTPCQFFEFLPLKN